MLLLAVMAVFSAARVASRRWIFPVHEVPLQDVASNATKRAFLARDGTMVHALELEARDEARTVVYFHNNRETVESRLDLAEALHRRGLGVLLV
jgi:hypothetical protein